MSSPWSSCPSAFCACGPIRSDPRNPTVQRQPPAVNPLPDRTLLIGLLATLGLVFALVFWSVRLAPPSQPPLQWREGPLPAPAAPAPPASSGLLT